MPLPDQFFTLESMLTLTGASGATFLVCNGLQRAFNFNPKWLALAVAMVLSLVGTYLAGKREGVDYFVGVINGFLIYATAAGGTEIAAGGRNHSENREDEHNTYGAGLDGKRSPRRRRFASSWFQ